MSNHNAVSNNDRILRNGRLFVGILKNRRPEEKLRKIQKYLDLGADINAGDANNENNTPLHVAVAREEIQVVQFLLGRGADIDTINIHGQTPLEIAKHLRTPDGKRIAQLLQECHSATAFISSNQKDTRVTIGLKQHNNDITDVQTKYQSHKLRHSSPKRTSISEYVYQKRCGTSGLSGQLYETKLLCLILFRALNNHKVTHFSLATNIDGMGAFDDIVLRYVTSEDTKPKVIFLQAKHRDDPTKDKITFEEMFKQNGDFSLHKYLDSYIKISQRFSPNTSDEVFTSVFINTDCQFIIYTSAMEKCSRKKVKVQTDEQYFINTTDNGEIFQLEYDDQDVDLLVQSVVRSRASLIAKKLVKYILRDNCSNMMSDEVIKTYHVFLAQRVLALRQSTSTPSQYIGNFRDTFLETEDNILMILKECICKEVAIIKSKSSSFQQSEIESILKSLTVKVPANFGNLNFCFGGNEQRKRRRLNYLFSILQRICQNAVRSNSDLTDFVIKVDDSMVGPKAAFQDSDFEPFRLAGLVGNLLVLDSECQMLKFNMDEQYLSSDCIELRDMLQAEASIGNDLKKYRLDISVHVFPRLALFHEENDRQLVKSFLNNLTFYTNQAKEDVVESVAKHEIDKYYNAKSKNDSLFRLKVDAIFLKVHDKVQKWWQQPKSAPYLTENCTFYHESEHEILRSPLLSILNFTFRENLKNIQVEFDDSAVGSLELDSFLISKAKALHIVTAENKLTALKIIQYFTAADIEGEYTLVDMDYVKSVDCFDSVSIETRESKASAVLIIICENGSDTKDLNKNINLLLQLFKGKIIIITNNVLAKQFEFEVPVKDVVQKQDECNNLNNLTPKCRQKLLEQNIIYQGSDISLGLLLDEGSTHFIDSSVLRKLFIDSDKISIGETITNASYAKTADYYVEQTMCRHITLKTIDKKYDDLFIANSREVKASIPEGVKDIVLVADTENEFDLFCHQYRYTNIHWFRSEDNLLLWKKSRGRLATLLKYVSRGSNDSRMVHVKTLNDLDEKMVIISGEPGMGKSTLLTHLAIQTKHVDPALWISKINLIEHTATFLKWKVNHTKVDYTEVMKFMFQAVGLQAFKVGDGKLETLRNLMDIIEIMICVDQRTNENVSRKEIENVSDLELFEIKLFYHLYKNCQVSLLLDGFDEICPDYANEVMDMINIFKDSKLAYLWITARSYNTLNKLEDGLEIFSYVLQPLTPIDQRKILQKIWSKTLGYEDLNILLYVEEFFNMISVCLDDGNNKFTSLPLHLNMLAELFEDFFKGFFDSDFYKQSKGYKEYIIMRTLNLISLYERFVDMKFMEIRFGEKKRFMCIDDPDMRKLVEKERMAFVQIHKKISVHFLFDIPLHNYLSPSVPHEIQELWFSDKDIREIDDMIEIIRKGEEKTGIIERVIGKEPKFIHLTFAEYFATEFVCDKLKSEHCTPSMWKFLVNDILLFDKRGMRRFLNSKLAMDDALVATGTLNHSYSTAVFNALLLQCHLPTNSLMTAVDEYLGNIAMFLMLCVKSVVTKNNLDNFIKLVNQRCFRYCVVCASVERRDKNTIKSIIDIIKNVNEGELRKLFYCGDMPSYNALLVALAYIEFDEDREVLTLLMNEIRHNGDLMVELLTLQYDDYYTSVAHSLARQNILMQYFYPYFLELNKKQRVAIFGVANWEGQTPAHYAAQSNNYMFFHVLHDLLDIEQFRYICMKFDSAEWPPVYYLPYNRHYCHDLKNLFEKVYNVTILNVDNFLFNVVRKRDEVKQ